MWPVTHTEITDAPPAAVWRLWESVPRWPEWDEGLDAIEFAGALTVGSAGRITPTGGPSWPFTIISAEPGVRFTDETRLPLCRLRFAHELGEAGGGRTAVTITVSFHGLLAPLFRRVIGKDIAADLGPQTARLVAVAEREHQAAASSATLPA